MLQFTVASEMQQAESNSFVVRLLMTLEQVTSISGGDTMHKIAHMYNSWALGNTNNSEIACSLIPKLLLLSCFRTTGLVKSKIMVGHLRVEKIEVSDMVFSHAQSLSAVRKYALLKMASRICQRLAVRACKFPLCLPYSSTCNVTWWSNGDTYLCLGICARLENEHIPHSLHRLPACWRNE